MTDAQKSKAQLLQEVAELRQQLAACQASEARREPRRAEQALAERIRQAEAVRAITAEITRELNLTTLLGLITQCAVDLVAAATSGVVYLWDTAAEVLTTQAWHGPSPRPGNPTSYIARLPGDADGGYRAAPTRAVVRKLRARQGETKFPLAASSSPLAAAPRPQAPLLPVGTTSRGSRP